jgi:hypothetical protein
VLLLVEQAAVTSARPRTPAVAEILVRAWDGMTGSLVGM